MIKRRRTLGLGLPLAGMVILGVAAPAAAAPTATFAATISVDSACVFTIVASWKNAKVAAIDLGWYEAGYQNADYPTIHDWVATSQYPQNGTLVKKSVVFTAGPAPTTDTVNHQWWGNVTFRDASGALLTQFDTNILSTPCYLPSPPPA